jgi:beta-carotene 15,15'-dioxygenase
MVGERGCVMRDLEYRLFSQVRSFSSTAVISTILLSLALSQFLGENSIHWQVVIAVIALAVGIPHGALDHLVTLPKSKPTVMALFITLYVLDRSFCGYRNPRI